MYKHLFKDFTIGIGIHYLITYGLPSIGTAIIFGIGYFGKYPWFYIILGVMAAFAFLNMGIFYFSQWVYYRSIKDKLSFSAVIIGIDRNTGGILLGVQLKNHAHFPIMFQIKTIRVSIGTTIPEDNNIKANEIIIPPNGIGWNFSNPINLNPIPINTFVEGFIEYDIKYGKKDALKYNISGKKQVILGFNDAGLISQHSWNDAN